VELTRSFERVFPSALLDRYEFRETRNAAAVLSAAAPDALAEIVDVLTDFELAPEDVLGAGGNKSNVAARLDRAFRQRGWREGRVDTRVTLEARLMPYAAVGETTPRSTTTEVLNEGYKVDNFKGRVALDVEWNAKDGNLDRDLAAYRALYDAATIDVAVIITRTQEDLRALALRLNPKTTKFNTTTTTNLGKLEPRLSRGDGGGCPVLAIAVCARSLGP
jgi:hypothetical protein